MTYSKNDVPSVLMLARTIRFVRCLPRTNVYPVYTQHNVLFCEFKTHIYLCEAKLMYCVNLQVHRLSDMHVRVYTLGSLSNWLLHNVFFFEVFFSWKNVVFFSIVKLMKYVVYSLITLFLNLEIHNTIIDHLLKEKWMIFFSEIWLLKWVQFWMYPKHVLEYKQLNELNIS